MNRTPNHLFELVVFGLTTTARLSWADSMTVAETYMDKTTAGVWTSSTDTGTFNASLTVPGLSSLNPSAWSNLLVTITSPLSTASDSSGHLGSFSDVMSDAPNFGGTVSSSGATFYFQLSDTNGSLVNAYRMSFSHSGNVLTIAGQTLNPAAVQPPWSILAGTFQDYSGDPTFSFTNQPISCEVLVEDGATGSQYADIVRTIIVTGTNTISTDTAGAVLNNIRLAGSADLTPPTLTAVSPTSSATVSSALLTVQVKAADNVGVSSVEFYVDGLDLGQGDYLGNNLWSMMFPLQPGTNIIWTVATDVAGNSSRTNALTMTYVNRQTNASLITYSEHYRDFSQVDQNGITNSYGYSVGAVNAALTVAALQTMSAATWSNLNLNVQFGGISFSNNLNFGEGLTTNSAMFSTIDGYQGVLSRSGNTLVLLLSFRGTEGLYAKYLGESGQITDSVAFNLSLSDNVTTYLALARTVYLAGTNVITYDAAGDQLNNIQITGAADYLAPTNLIVSPAPRQTVSNAVFTVVGKAGDNIGVSNVLYSLNHGPWASAATANHWTNWTAQVTLAPGTNVIQAFAVDTGGNYSTTSAVSFVYVVFGQLQLQTLGLGTFAPDYSNAMLQIGKNYSITPTPAKGFKFADWTLSTNWVGSALVTGPSLTFTMEPGLTLLATFADTNPPTLAISSPANNQRMTNALAMVKGTAGDNWKVSGVWCQLNGAAWTPASTANGWTNWAAALPLAAGTNMLKAYALDLGGNYSKTSSVSFYSGDAFNLRLLLATSGPLLLEGPTVTVQLSSNLTGHLEYSTNLSNWIHWTDFRSTNTSLSFRDNAATNSPQRFYRAVVP